MINIYLINYMCIHTHISIPHFAFSVFPFCTLHETSVCETAGEDGLQCAGGQGMKTSGNW